jgi:phosphotransferase system enzyme I (PtsP)
MIRSLRLRPLATYMQTLLSLPDHSVRDKIRAYANDHAVTV